MYTYSLYLDIDEVDYVSICSDQEYGTLAEARSAAELQSWFLLNGKYGSILNTFFYDGDKLQKDCAVLNLYYHLGKISDEIHSYDAPSIC